MLMLQGKENAFESCLKTLSSRIMRPAVWIKITCKCCMLHGKDNAFESCLKTPSVSSWLPIAKTASPRVIEVGEIT